MYIRVISKSELINAKLGISISRLCRIYCTEYPYYEVHITAMEDFNIKSYETYIEDIPLYERTLFQKRRYIKI